MRRVQNFEKKKGQWSLSLLLQKIIQKLKYKNWKVKKRKEIAMIIMIRTVLDRRYYCYDCKKEREKRVSVRLKVWKWPIPTMRLYAITYSVFGKRDRRYDCAYHSSKTSWYFRITCVIRITRLEHVFFMYIYRTRQFRFTFSSIFH